MMKWFQAGLIKVAVLMFAVLSLTGLTYRAIGWWQRRRGGWGSVFYCYAGSRKFIDSYAMPGIVGFFRWRPSPIGLLQQDGRWGLVLASPVTEAEFLDPANAEDFARLQIRLTRIAALMGVEVINMAGILPGVLGRSNLIRVNDSRPIVVSAVCAAVQEVTSRALPQDARDVIVLGGGGHVGRAVCEALAQSGLQAHPVDVRAGQAQLPKALNGQPCLLVDIARKGAIGSYIRQMWPGLVVLNEVFPCPSRRHVTAMTAQGVKVFHLAGVAGRIIPPLPHGYEEAVPCCATHAPGVTDVRVIQLGVS